MFGKETLVYFLKGRSCRRAFGRANRKVAMRRRTNRICNVTSVVWRLLDLRRGRTCVCVVRLENETHMLPHS